MRYLLIAIYKKAVVWFSIMMIPYCVFSSFLEEYPSLIFIIRIILATAFAIIAIGGMMSYLFSYIEIPRRPLKEKGIIRTLYLNSDKIIVQLYCWFLVLYITFNLEYKSILYNLLMLFFIGLFWGYKITMKANRYTLEEVNRKKQERKQNKELNKGSKKRVRRNAELFYDIVNVLPILLFERITPRECQGYFL